MKAESEPAPSSAGKATSLIERKFQRLGLHAPSDFVVHLPLRYEDETSIVTIDGLRPGQSAQVEGEILNCDVLLRPRRQLVAQIQDDTGVLALRWLHFYPSQLKQLEAGKRVRVRGEVRSGFTGLEIVHPKVTQAGAALAQALTPVYPSTDGLNQNSLRKAIERALTVADLSDTLPADIVRRYDLMAFAPAIRFLHHPPPHVTQDDLLQKAHPAWRRIKFDEILARQLSLVAARRARQAQHAHALEKTGGIVQALRENLPFALTSAQKRVVAEISSDLRRTFPMHRLLLGDVGSGKTIVAALAAAQAIANDSQVAMMAPTEILAEQHYQKLSAWLRPLGVKLAWLAGSLGVKAKRTAIEDIASGQAQCIIGTQALIQEKVSFARLGLIILDEQHRFGVGQRLLLGKKGESHGPRGVPLIPHQLTMSATPIPRTLAMTFFADLDLSTIDELPPGRSTVITKLVDEQRREEVLHHVTTEVRQGRQAYWVCPLVEESEALQLQTALETFEHLKAVLPDLRIGLVHGKLPTQEKQDLMTAFRAGTIDLLVATTVIEVGVDVPNASLMIIEHAERFGLAQLHQLRGRVGRGTAKSVCVLLYQSPLSYVARQRLRTMYEVHDGFEIARRDLEMRGPGEFLGVRQSGQDLLKFADLNSDAQLVEQAQQAAKEMDASYPEHTGAHLARWMRNKEDFLRS
ncbi:MAG: ATP-dependent DNA helicase RecG [Candidimonas sp.]